MRKRLSSGQKWFLRPYFPLIGACLYSEEWGKVHFNKRKWPFSRSRFGHFQCLERKSKTTSEYKHTPIHVGSQLTFWCLDCDQALLHICARMWCPYFKLFIWLGCSDLVIACTLRAELCENGLADNLSVTTVWCKKQCKMKIVTVKSYIFGLGRFDLTGFSLTQFKSMPISYPGWIISVIHTWTSLWIIDHIFHHSDKREL